MSGHSVHPYLDHFHSSVGKIGTVTAAVLPNTLTRMLHQIDYTGTVLLAGVATSMVLLTTLAGTTYAWDSIQILGLAVISFVLLGGFILVEHQASEPVLSFIVTI